MMANDTDVEGGTLTVTAASNATDGTACAQANGAVTFTPAANFSGTAGFDYTVSDGTLTDIGQVTVTVTGVNDAPVAVDDTTSTPEDTARDSHAGEADRERHRRGREHVTVTARIESDQRHRGQERGRLGDLHAGGEFHRDGRI